MGIKEPGCGEVLIKIKAAGLCGIDYELYTNDMVYLKEGRSKLPIIPGHEWSGVVEKIGEYVSNFKVDDKVTGECTVSCGKCYYCERGIHNQCLDRTETGIMNREGGFKDVKKGINPRGRVVLNGFFGSKNAVIDWDFFTVNDISIFGTLGSLNIWDEVITMLETGKIETKSLISHVMKLSEFEKGLDIMVNRKENACNVILKP